MDWCFQVGDYLIPVPAIAHADECADLCQKAGQCVLHKIVEFCYMCAKHVH